MKWFLAAAAVFLGSFVMFLALPYPVLIQVRDVMENSLDHLAAELRPIMNRTAEQSEPAMDGLRDRIESRVHDRLSGSREEPTANRVSGRIENRRSGTFRANLSGIARVLDGDTIEIGSDRVRLWGIDAPEGRQTCRDGSRHRPCGRRAAQALAGRIDGRGASGRWEASGPVNAEAGARWEARGTTGPGVDPGDGIGIFVTLPRRTPHERTRTLRC